MEFDGTEYNKEYWEGEMKRREHKLKTWPVFYWDVVTGAKTFEIRKNDRDYQVSDILVLQEYIPEENRYTGEECRVIVNYTVRLDGLPGIPNGFIAMSTYLEENDLESHLAESNTLYQKALKDVVKLSLANQELRERVRELEDITKHLLEFFKPKSSLIPSQRYWAEQAEQALGGQDDRE
jgi:hypothetical protein